MKRRLAILLLVLLGAATAGPATAEGFATVTVNDRTLTLDTTGSIITDIDGVVVHLEPGESQEFSMTFSMSVASDGLPAPIDPRALGCTSLHRTICGPQYDGHEYARVAMLPFFIDGRRVPPFIHITGTGGVFERILTEPDESDHLLTQSGTLTLHVSNDSFGSPFDGAFVTTVGLWVLEVPEPSVTGQLLAGLGMLGLLLSARVRHDRTSRLDATPRSP